MKSNTQSRMNTVIGGAIGGATVTFEVIAVLGYLTFGSEVIFIFVLIIWNFTK
jgi:hypothetical protein